MTETPERQTTEIEAAVPAGAVRHMMRNINAAAAILCHPEINIVGHAVDQADNAAVFQIEGPKDIFELRQHQYEARVLMVNAAEFVDQRHHLYRIIRDLQKSGLLDSSRRVV